MIGVQDIAGRTRPRSRSQRYVNARAPRSTWKDPAEAAAFGVPDDKWGEAVKAVAVRDALHALPDERRARRRVGGPASAADDSSAGIGD